MSVLNWLIALQSYPSQRSVIKDHFTIYLCAWKFHLSHILMYKTLVLLGVMGLQKPYKKRNKKSQDSKIS